MASRPPNPIGPLRSVFLPQPPKPSPTAPTLNGSGRNEEEEEESTNSTALPVNPDSESSPCEVPDPIPRTGILSTLDAMFRFLNKTSLNMTQDCWLCLNPEPPYYTGIGANASVGDSDGQIKNLSLNETHGPICKWGHNPKLTLDNLQGQGTCIYPNDYSLSSSPYKGSCTSHLVLSNSNGELTCLLAAPEGTWWVCTNGITPCLFPLALKGTQREGPRLCVLTHILPQVYYYSGEGGREHLGLEPKRQRRAPVLVPSSSAWG